MEKKDIWSTIRSFGFSEKATASIMGNMESESNCAPCRIQGDFSYGYEKSKVYTLQVDTGAIGRSDFIYHGPGGGGYGLCQWTYPTRKAGLYDLCMARGSSIGDGYSQLLWLMEELKSGYNPTLATLLNDNNKIPEMTAVFMRKFEMPSDQSDGALSIRISQANSFYEEFSGTVIEENDSEGEGSIDATETCRPEFRVLKKGDKGNDVTMAQCALKALGYDLGTSGPYKNGIDGDFGSKTELAVNDIRARMAVIQNGRISEDIWQILAQ